MRTLLTIQSIFVATLLSCNNNSHQDVSVIDTQSAQKNLQPKPVHTVSKPEAPATYKDQYTFSSDSLTETLYVSPVSKNTISVLWVLTDHRLQKSDTLQGLAVDRTPEQDLEIDETEDGIAYPAEEYTLENATCQTYFRISIDKEERRALVKSADCRTKAGKPIESIGSLKWSKWSGL